MPRQPDNTLQQESVPMSEEDEIEYYALLIFKYSLIFEEQAAATRSQQKEFMEAHAKVSEEHNERMKMTFSLNRLNPSIEELHDMLKFYGELCEISPQTGQSVLE